MTEDELVEEFIDLQETVDEMDLRLEAFSRWKESTNERLGEVVDENQRLREENNDLRQRLDDLESTAEQAITIASRGHDPASRNKTEHAKCLTRNTLVKRAANGGAAADRKITISDIQKIAEPEYTLKWQTVRNGWNNLREEWPQFRDTTKDGEQAITISRKDVTKALARQVEADLERTDLAKRFVGDTTDGGSSE